MKEEYEELMQKYLKLFREHAIYKNLFENMINAAKINQNILDEMIKQTEG